MRTARIVVSMACATISMWTPAQAACIVEEQLWKVRGDAITRGAELAKQQQPILREIDKINNTAKDPARPIGPQLSTQDLARFSELRQRLLAIELQQMLESDYDRDYRVIGELFTLMQELYVGGKVPVERDANYKSYGIILFMRYAAQMDDFKGVTNISVPPRTDFEKCTMAAALHLVEHESITKLNQLPINESTQKLLELRAKSHTPSGAIDRDKLSSQDRAIYDSIMRTTIAPGNHEQSFIEDLESLKNVVIAADIKFSSYKKDATDSGGSAETIGQTLRKINLDKRTTFGLAILNAMAKVFPSERTQQYQQIQELLRAQSQGKK